MYQSSQHSEYNSGVSGVNISAQSAQSTFQDSLCSQYIIIVSVVHISGSLYQLRQYISAVSKVNISAQSVQSIYQPSQRSQHTCVVSLVNISAYSVHDFYSSISKQPLMTVLSIIICTYNEVIVVYDEIVFDVEFKITGVGVANISTQSAQSIYQRIQRSQYISVVSVVNISTQPAQSIYQNSQRSQHLSVVTLVNISLQSAQSIYQGSQCSQYISIVIVVNISG